ncbi:MAG: trehalose operon repressor [Lachnospiraceae bacterium]|nr:trehalose operon repressor [Lachnospiraceae bacterium]MBR0152414.1 trehalose operon repressor [Lachnospiraceae bacterium]
MPKKRYESIYQDLKREIEEQTYRAGSLLPSENSLTELFGCARNTIRRAVAQLAAEGYVQPIHGKGVQVIYRPKDKAEFIVGGIESFKESALRNRREPGTRVVVCEEMNVSESLAERTGFPAGAAIWHVERIRFLDGVPLIRDIHYFLKSEVGELTPEIAEDSVYRYLEEDLGMQITMGKRRITAERASKEDASLLELGKHGFDFVAVITGKIYNSNGVQFEYTQSRHRPDAFYFYDTATRSHGRW